MLSNLRKATWLPAVRRWDSVFDAVMNHFDPFSGEELNPDFDGPAAPEIIVTDQSVTVRMALPGFAKEEISIEVENDVLHVRAEHSKKCDDELCKGRKMLRCERSHSAFAQSLRLPADVKEDEAAACSCDGILTVTIPRADAAKQLPRRKIEVK